MKQKLQMSDGFSTVFMNTKGVIRRSFPFAKSSRSSVVTLMILMCHETKEPHYPYAI